MEKPRNCNIDLIHILACMAVVGLHSFDKDVSYATSFIYYLCGFAIPAFFMASGYFLLNRGSVDVKYSLRKVIGIIRLVFVWNIVVLGMMYVCNLIEGEAGVFNIVIITRSVLNSFIQKGYTAHFWYLGAMMILYVLLYLLSRLNEKWKVIVTVISGLIAVVLEICSILTHKCVQANVIQTFRIWTWIFYFMLGSRMKQITNIIASKINAACHLIILCCYTVLNLIWQNYAGTYLIIHNYGKRLQAEYFYDSILEIVWIILLISFLIRLDIQPEFEIVIEKCSPLTMGVYIVHPIWQMIMMKICLWGGSLVMDFIYWAITLFGAVAIVWIIEKTPLRRVLLKL
jgi:surface polysaccharide O-acyltransferase-like enzyme